MVVSSHLDTSAKAFKSVMYSIKSAFNLGSRSVRRFHSFGRVQSACSILTCMVPVFCDLATVIHQRNKKFGSAHHAGFVLHLCLRGKVSSNGKMTICGTDEYMAPEMLFDESFSYPADMFSFGELLMSRCPSMASSSSTRLSTADSIFGTHPLEFVIAIRWGSKVKQPAKDRPTSALILVCLVLISGVRGCPVLYPFFPIVCGIP